MLNFDCERDTTHKKQQTTTKSVIIHVGKAFRNSEKLAVTSAVGSPAANLQMYVWMLCIFVNQEQEKSIDYLRHSPNTYYST